MKKFNPFGYIKKKKNIPLLQTVYKLNNKTVNIRLIYFFTFAHFIYNDLVFVTHFIKIMEILVSTLLKKCWEIKEIVRKGGGNHNEDDGIKKKRKIEGRMDLSVLIFI